jgi:hypothetical protein
MSCRKSRLGTDLVSEWFGLSIGQRDCDTLNDIMPEVKSKCEACGKTDRFQHAAAICALDAGDYMRTMGIIRAGCWPTYAVSLLLLVTPTLGSANECMFHRTTAST